MFKLKSNIGNNERKKEMSYNEVLELLEIPDNDKIVDLILDTDAFNEQDDQFAIAHAMLSPEKINLLSIIQNKDYDRPNKGNGAELR